MPDLRRRRAAAQLLDRSGPAGPATLARRLLAVQAQDLGAARLALRARAPGLTAAGVDAALADGSVVVAWLLRGTLHLVAAEDHGWLLGLTAPTRMATSRRRLAQLGVGEPDAERAVALVERALAAEGQLTRAQLTERLAAAGIPTAGQAAPHLLMLAALRGLTVLGPVAPGGGHAYVLARDWLGAAPAAALQGAARERALAELARRYLTAHGPAGAADLAAWSGLPLRDARAGLGAIAAELAEREDGAVDLAGRGAAPGAPVAPRLLGAFDPYLLGFKDRSFAVAPEHARRVHPGGGIVRAVALRDGWAVGTWSARRRAGRLAIAIEPFEALDGATAAALRDEAADVARFEGLTLAGG